MNDKRNLIITGTITYAIKGRDLLRRKGISANIERINSTTGNTGCGYGVSVSGNIDKAVELFKKGGVKILEVTRAE